jgi:nucleolar protein 56
LDISLLIKANIIRSARAKRNGPDDSNILSSVGAITEIDSTINLLQERIAEWIGKIWEEPGKHLMEKGVLDSLAASASLGEFSERLGEINPGLKERMEGSLPDPESSLQGIPLLASSLQDLYSKRRALESYIDSEMDGVAPNLKKVVGPVIGARLIQSAAGLMRLALLPASTVQVLGAEKAFFKFLKEGGKPPKHGILFQHPQVHSARRDLRGKMARTIANAASRAARLDAYGGVGGDDIRSQLDAKIERMRTLPVKQKGGPTQRQPPFREGWWATKGQGPERPGPRRKFTKRRH